MIWRIPVEWSFSAIAEVEAPTLEMAIDAADYLEDFPDNEEYIDDSYGVPQWLSTDEIRDKYNDGQNDGSEESFFRFKKGDRVLYEGKPQIVIRLCVQNGMPEYELRPTDASKQIYWWPIAENKLRRIDSGNSAGIQELFE